MTDANPPVDLSMFAPYVPRPFINLELDGDRILVTVHNVHRNPALPLFSYAITALGGNLPPAASLVELVDELCGQVKLSYRAGIAREYRDPQVRMRDVMTEPLPFVNDPGQPWAQLARVDIDTVHGPDPDDWFG